MADHARNGMTREEYAAAKQKAREIAEQVAALLAELDALDPGSTRGRVFGLGVGIEKADRTGWEVFEP